MRKDLKARLVTGSISKILTKMTIPMIWGMLSMMAFNFADTYFVSRLGTIPLAAMGFIFPVVMTINHLAVGLGVGASSVIAREIGEGDTNKVKRLATDGLILSVVIVLGIVVVGFCTVDILFKSLGASPETMFFIKEYMSIWYAGMIFVVVPMVGNNIIRASGDALWPGMIMLTGSVINIILDPIMIFGIGPVPEMGIRGAAVATVIARALTMILSLWVLSKRKKLLAYSIASWKKTSESFRKILYVGIPSSIGMMIPTISLAILTWMVSLLGQKAVAGFGVAGRVEGFALVIFMALSSVFGPFVGQNWGAHKYKRINIGLSLVTRFALICGVFQAVLLFFLARPITELFTNDSEVARIAILYLSIVPISYGAAALTHLASAAFNALNKPIPSVILMAARLLFLHIPLAYLGLKVFGIVGFLLATHIACAIVALWAIAWVRNACRCPRQS